MNQFPHNRLRLVSSARSQIRYCVGKVLPEFHDDSIIETKVFCFVASTHFLIRMNGHPVGHWASGCNGVTTLLSLALLRKAIQLTEQRQSSSYVYAERVSQYANVLTFQSSAPSTRQMQIFDFCLVVAGSDASRTRR